MSATLRSLAFCFLILTLFPRTSRAQYRESGIPADGSDREIVMSTLESVREAVAEVLIWVGDQVGSAESWVEDRARRMQRARTFEEMDAAVAGIEREIERMRRQATTHGEARLARELAKVERQLADVKRELAKASRSSGMRRVEVTLETAGRENGNARRTERTYDWRSNAHRWPGHSSYGYGIDPFGDHIVTMFGSVPFYADLPGLRYNRVDGFVLGLDVEPIRFGSSRRSKLYGQIGYAFGIDDIRYQAGFETKIGHTRRYSDFGVTAGVSYHKNTASEDTWKVDQWENSLASFFFRNDFLDYYESEGWNVYLKRYFRAADASVRVGYRSADQRSLVNSTSWSVFRDGTFRANPPVADGHMNELVVAVEAGEFYRFYRHPKGAAIRVTAELGQDFGGDFSFNRYVADGRAFFRVARDVGISIRGRGGYATAFAPPQRRFTIGGIGTVRAYPQNLYAGTRMLLSNAEVAFSQVDMLITDAQLFGFADAGWVGDDFDTFDFDEAFYAAGAGIALDDRHVRFEIAWPINDSFRKEPTLWFRLNPTF